MVNIFNKYSKLFDRLTLPLKLLGLVIIIAPVLLLWYRSFWLEIASESQTIQQRIATIESQLPTLKNRKQQLTDENQRGNDNHVAQLKRDIKTTLHQLVSLNHKLTLIELQSSSMDEFGDGKKLGSNGLLIRFAGDYFSTMAYLKAIEKLPLEIFWDKLDYRVTHYPMAEITLHLHLVEDN